MPTTTQRPRNIITGRRGCGTRIVGGVYLETRVTERGLPVAHYLFDPPLVEGEIGEPSWFHPHRSPFTFVRDNVTHLVVWVGEQFYPSVWDFIEEVRAIGSSRRVPRTFDFSQLTVQSRMFFVHPHAQVVDTGSLPFVGCDKHGQGARCLKTALILPTSDGDGYENDTIEAHGVEMIERKLPCGASYLRPEVDDPMATQPGLFMWLPVQGVAMIQKQDGTVDEAIEQRAKMARGLAVYRARA